MSDATKAETSEPGERLLTDSLRASAGAEAGWFGVFYGWYTVAITVVATMLVVGTTNYSFALFVRPVSEQLGLSRASINSGLILFFAGTALLSPFMGKVLDRYPTRPIVLISAALFGAGMVIIPATSSVLVMALCILLPIAVGSLGCGGLFSAVVVARWFHHQRGRALAISAMGTSLGGLVVFPIIAVLVDRLGWRKALTVAGVAIWLAVSALALLLRTTPRPLAHSSGAKPDPRNRAWLAREILRSTPFWIIGIAISLLLGVDGAILATVTPYVQERGFTLVEVTTLMTATTASAIAGKILIAWVIDRTDLRILIAITAFLGVIQCGVLLTTPSYILMLVINSLSGMAVGGTYPLYSAIVAERFGVVSYGWVRGLMSPVNSIFASVTLYLAGAMYDRSRHYTAVYWMLLISTVVSMVLILTLKKFEHPKSTSPARAA